MKYNPEFDKLPESYVFRRISALVAAMKNSSRKVLDLGVGDVKLPLFPKAVEEMKKACDELGNATTFKGYPDARGLPSLRKKIADDYFSRGINIKEDEIFVSDGAKSDLSGLFALFGRDADVLIPEPCYPAYAEAAVLYGDRVTFVPSSEQDGFIPFPPYSKAFDVIFLCSPNNPTGAAMTADELSLWVGYALKTGAVIIFDGAYSDYADEGYPRSVYEVRGAENCAIEVRSFSKPFAFTGVRCGYTVIPRSLGKYNALWNRKLGCTFNGVSYVSQKGAEAFFDAETKKQVKKRINYYKDNAEIIKTALAKAGTRYALGRSSPYVFAKCPKGYSSEEFCAALVEKHGLVTTPGSAFGASGEGFFRLSAFAPRDEIFRAADILNKRDGIL